MANEPPKSGLKSNPTLTRSLSDQKRAKTEDGAKRRIRVQWDEENLRVNEEIKAELDCDKIDLPDTPFIRSPLAVSDDEDENGSAAVAGASSVVAEAFAKVEKLAQEQKAAFQQ